MSLSNEYKVNGGGGFNPKIQGKHWQGCRFNREPYKTMVLRKKDRQDKGLRMKKTPKSERFIFTKTGSESVMFILFRDCLN